jgi:hypothetical protein
MFKTPSGNLDRPFQLFDELAARVGVFCGVAKEEQQIGGPFNAIVRG